ncbi:GNAT family N-acetyltransferase [Mangrovibacillus cuniculi]|uniref:GNAT family N-acetyltransferase n=2 Tax=Mangrovibacillus cuniculi TaxID=2593652 RepID=A0A7S8CE33_9BACI|nr:GNAT family N-acetyltransferase [Mangrovibacillus cuniculi]
MTQEQAEEIAYTWHYDGVYSFYNMEADEEDLAEFLDPAVRKGSVYAVSIAQDLVGFLSMNRVREDTIDIGLGLKPELTGRGAGAEFMTAGLNFIQKEFGVDKVTLAVATFNQRAIKLYRNVGFEDVEVFMQETNGSTYEFLRMEYYY